MQREAQNQHATPSGRKMRRARVIRRQNALRLKVIFSSEIKLILAVQS
jgi:hypothetical protein